MNHRRKKTKNKQNQPNPKQACLQLAAGRKINGKDW